MDPRIRMMIENGVKSKQRTMFVVVGDKGRDQVFAAVVAPVDSLVEVMRAEHPLRLLLQLECSRMLCLDYFRCCLKFETPMMAN